MCLSCRSPFFNAFPLLTTCTPYNRRRPQLRAGVSATPGATQKLHFYSVGRSPPLTVVDLPGYGKAYMTEMVRSASPSREGKQHMNFTIPLLTLRAVHSCSISLRCLRTLLSSRQASRMQLQKKSTIGRTSRYVCFYRARVENTCRVMNASMVRTKIFKPRFFERI